MVYGRAVKAMVTTLWFLTAFVAGAAIFAINRPSPILQALVIQLKGRDLLHRCHQAGACGKPTPQEQRPIPPLPSDMDRA